MPKVFNLYLDDSGTRHPDHSPGTLPSHGCDWFALGGILLNETDEGEIRNKYDAFCASWGIDYPLHSCEIRAKSENFRWLRTLSKYEYGKFMASLRDFLIDIPVFGHACVIDRPGYNARYKAQYGKGRWGLPKTAFSVVVERSAKYAIAHNARLRVLIERCNPKEDRKIERQFNELMQGGMPFNSGTSGKYQPLTPENFQHTLYEFRQKRKTSPLIQIADLYLWPICMGGYRPANRPYCELKGAGRLLDCTLDPERQPTIGIKYSCFELVLKTDKAQT